MGINILAVGKIKEPSMVSLIDLYMKRIKAYSKITVTEIPDLPVKKGYDTLSEEGQNILKHLKNKKGKIIALCIEGKQISSPQLAQKINETFIEVPTINFIIGGSLGLSEEVKQCAHECISLSKMTFPHNIARLLLLEQIYRAFKINKNQTYHK